MRLIKNIAKKYYRKGKSPQPFVFLRDLETDRLTKIKRSLIGTDFFFNDGTYFDGDVVRLEKLFGKIDGPGFGAVKLLSTLEIFQSKKLTDVFHEIYDFYVSEPVAIGLKDVVEIPVKSTVQGCKVFS